MTDFIRNILVNATVNAATAAASTAASSEAAVKAEMAKPVNQIQIPAVATLAATADCALPVEKQRLIKVEILPESTTPVAMAITASDAGKAQRAVRRDVVNARRDKRKAMAQSASSSVPSSPMEMTSCGGSSSDSEEELEDKSKKMKTSKTSSLAVVGGLAASENCSLKKPSLSSMMPPTPGLLFTPEIDAAGEERLRAMEAQLETLDPDSKEAKKKRRLIRNRMSAQLHRERKKAYVGQLEDQLLEKDREVKLLQEKMAKMMEDTEKLKTEVEKTKTLAPTLQPTLQPAASTKPTPVAKTSSVEKTVRKADDEVVIKEEPQSWDSPWPLDAAETWDLHGLEDSEMADLETSDLLRDFDDPFAGLGGAEYADLCKPHHEIHAAKKNLAMMAAVMFSVSFFGNSPSFYNVTPGSSFSSTFGAQPPKEFSQMSIASRIVACLEKTSWKEFRDVSSWLSARTADAAAQQKEDADETDDEDTGCVRPVASPSAASDVTDTTGSSCGSPVSMIDDCLDDAAMTETDLIDEFEYPVEDPFGAGAGADWLVDEHDVNKDTHKKEDFFLTDFVMNDEPRPTLALPPQQPAAKSSASLSSRLYESLTALWREKNQVLLTVRNDKQQVLQRSIADMSTIREGLQSGNFFTKVFGDSAAPDASQQDQSVTFLYPMSAFASDAKPLLAESVPVSDATAAADPVFLEVSCQMNGAVAASQL